MAEIRYYVSSGLRPHLYLWVADPRQVAFLCLPKEKRPKERAPRSRRHLPALLGKIGARLTRRALNNAPWAQTRGSLLPIFPPMLGGGYGVLKAPPREDWRCVASIPVGARRAGNRSWCVRAAKRPGVLLFGSFLLDKQEKGTQGAGAEPPAISLSSRARSARSKWIPVGQPPTSTDAAAGRSTSALGIEGHG